MHYFIILASLCFAAIAESQEISKESEIYLRKLKAIEKNFPEFIGFQEKVDKWAGGRIQVSIKEEDHYFAFVRYGSGVYISGLSCFRVDRDDKVNQIYDNRDRCHISPLVDPVKCSCLDSEY